MKFFTFVLSAVLFTLSFSNSAFSADSPCDAVAAVLSKSSYFKHVDLKGNLVGYVYFASTPTGEWMHYKSAIKETIVPKNLDSVVGRAGLGVDKNKCVFLIEARSRGLLGHEVVAPDDHSIEFKIQKGDTEVFFNSSLLVPILDQSELKSVAERFGE